MLDLFKGIFELRTAEIIGEIKMFITAFRNDIILFTNSYTAIIQPKLSKNCTSYHTPSFQDMINNCGETNLIP